MPLTQELIDRTIEKLHGELQGETPRGLEHILTDLSDVRDRIYALLGPFTYDDDAGHYVAPDGLHVSIEDTNAATALQRARERIHELCTELSVLILR